MYDHLYEHDLLTKYRSGFRFLHSQFCSCSAVRPVWSSLARFPRFCWHFFSVCTTSPKHSARKTYSLLCLCFWKKCFSSSIVVSLAKPNRCLRKTPAIFLRVLSQNFRQYFCYRNSSNLIWFLLGFFFVFLASQKAFVICTRVTSLHSCYRRAALLS